MRKGMPLLIFCYSIFGGGTRMGTRFSQAYLMRCDANNYICSVAHQIEKPSPNTNG